MPGVEGPGTLDRILAPPRHKLAEVEAGSSGVPTPGRASLSDTTIALVSDSPGYGGAEEYLRLLLEGIDARFVVVVGSEHHPRLGRVVRQAGADLVVVPGLGRTPRPGALLRLARVVRRLDPALVHVNLTDQGDGSGPIAALSWMRRRMVATLHLVTPRRPGWRDRVTAAAFRIPEVLICVSSHTGSHAEGLGARVTVIPDGIEAPRLDTNARGQLGLPEGCFVVGGIGRIHPQKGWDVLALASGVVAQALPDARFVVIGSPDPGGWPQLERPGALGRIQFVGPLDGAARYLGAFDVMVVPSRYEGLGLVALEAMAAGVPVIAAAVPGLRDALGDCAIYVPPGRPDRLAEAILTLADDPARRQELASMGLERQRRHFRSERMLEQLSALYAELAS